jgi:hypothetical protein
MGWSWGTTIMGWYTAQNNDKVMADVVLLDADPLADVANLSRAERVIKAGVVYDPKALIDSIR